MSQYIGIDLGTQSVKVVVFDADAGHIVARGQAELPAPRAPRHGAAEQDPADWWAAFERAMDLALAHPAVDRSALLGMGVSGQQHGFVPLGEDGAVLRPAKLWCDVEAVEEARSVSTLVGRPVPPGFTAPKVLWFQQHEPELAARLRHVVLPHDWLNFQLGGVLATDHGDASGTGLYHPIEGRYELEAAAAVHPDLPGQLLRLLDPDATHSHLLPKWCARFDLGEMPLSVGSGDNMMSALGAGATVEGTWILSLGTSGTIFGHSAAAVLDPSGVVAPFRDALGGGLPLVCTQNCSTVVDEARAFTGGTHEDLSAAAAGVPAGCDGLLFLPYLTGERSPDWPHACGVLHGLRPGGLRPERIYRAAIEGASLALAQGLSRLRDLDLPVDRLRLVGGGARNPLWARILCDLVQQPLEVAVEPESAALGAALQACWMESGRHPRSWTPAADPVAFEPDASLAAVYADLLERYTALGQQLFG
ncbi:MAG: xylulokinase [Chlamydiales bacterium]|jgi:xylulokinase